MIDVITIGSALVDIFIDTDRPESGNKICYPIGGKFLVKDLKFSTGGGGLNSAVALSKLGVRTGFLGGIGNDKNGEIILKELRKNKVKFIGTISKKSTGFSVILDTREKHRTILTNKGASDHLNFNKLKLRKLKTKWFRFSSMEKESHNTEIKLANFAKKNKIKICFAPSMYQLIKGIKPVKNILKKTDLLILNKEEASMLVKKGDILKGLHKLGPKIVCITDGEKEVIVSDKKYKYGAKPQKVKATEKTGAGDAFSSAFLAGLIKKNDIGVAIKAGILNAQSTIQKFGSKNGLLTRLEILKKLTLTSIKIKKETI
ncbi:MAG: carbohydrate kinase family protein [Candidatus Woesearchaeota archaeon]